MHVMCCDAGAMRFDQANQGPHTLWIVATMPPPSVHVLVAYGTHPNQISAGITPNKLR